jgi:hypothetical protein
MTTIEILQRLHDESAERGETMLAFLLDLAKTEAEDQVRQAGLDAEMRTALRDTSIIGFLSDVGGTPPQAAPARRRMGAVSGGARG